MLKEYKTLLPYIKKYTHYYVFGLIFLVVTDIAQLYIPQLIKGAIDILGTGEGTLQEVGRLMIIMVVVAFSLSLGRFGWRYFIHGASRRIENHLRDRLFGHLLTLSQSYYGRTKTGDLMARATNDMNHVRMAAGMGLVAFIDGVFMTMAILVILFTQYPKIALMTIIPFPIITVFILSFGPLLGKRFKEVQEGFAEISNKVQETMSGIRVIKSFVQTDYTLRQFTEVNDTYLAKNMKLVRIWGLFFPIVMFLSGITTLLLLRFGGVYVIEGGITTGDFVAVFSYLQMLVWPMMGVGWLVNLIQRGAASLGRINRVLEEKPEIMSPDKPVDGPIQGDIEVKNVTFTYPGADHPVLHNISFTIKEGQTLGILGRTGSGKTTLIRLLPRLLDPPQDSVFVGGVDVHDRDLVDLRKSIGLVPQESFLFSATIKENIAFGNPDAPESLISDSAELSTISRELSAFPRGWETPVGERGLTLSGGQKQRVSISRAIIIDPKILIFDDALSAVDTDTEEKILKGFLAAREGRTNIVISHRISTLQSSDNIIVLDNGSIVQQGTHEELVNQDGFYQEIYQMQQLTRQNR